MRTHATWRSSAPTFIGRGAGRRIAGLIMERIGPAVKRLQYARMIQALNELPDHQLTEIGLRRAEIPAHAYRLIYEHS